ncbi:MAG: thioredoxin family protein [Planctomyces sp.]
MRGLQTLTAFLCVCLMTCLGAAARADQIPWQTDVEAALREASQSGQPVLMQFTASWCSYCKRMEKSTWTDPELAGRVSKDFVAVLVDADEHKELLQDLEIKGLPTVLVVSPKLEVIHRISGFQTAEAMQSHLDRAERQNAARAAQSRTVRSAPSAAAGRTPPAAATAGRTPPAGSRTPPAAAAAKRAAPDMARTARPPAAQQPAAKPPAARSAARDTQVPVKSISRQGTKSSDEELPEFPVEPEDYSAARDRRSGRSAEREPAAVVEPESFRDSSAARRSAAAAGAPSETATYPDDWSDTESPDVVHRSAPVNPPAATAKPQRKPAGATESPVPARTGTAMAQAPLQPAFGGNSLVSARDARAVVAGSSRHQLKWKGQLLYFATAEELEMFSANPQRYWPMLDGDCALKLLQSNRRVQGDLEHAALFRGRVWVFSTAEEMREFVAAPADVADEVQALLEQ